MFPFQQRVVSLARPQARESESHPFFCPVMPSTLRNCSAETFMGPVPSVFPGAGCGRAFFLALGVTCSKTAHAHNLFPSVVGSRTPRILGIKCVVGQSYTTKG